MAFLILYGILTLGAIIGSSITYWYLNRYYQEQITNLKNKLHNCEVVTTNLRQALNEKEGG